MKSRLTLIQTIVVCFVLCSLALGQDPGLLATQQANQQARQAAQIATARIRLIVDFLHWTRYASIERSRAIDIARGAIRTD